MNSKMESSINFTVMKSHNNTVEWNCGASAYSDILALLPFGHSIWIAVAEPLAPQLSTCHSPLRLRLVSSFLLPSPGIYLGIFKMHTGSMRLILHWLLLMIWGKMSLIPLQVHRLENCESLELSGSSLSQHAESMTQNQVTTKKPRNRTLMTFWSLTTCTWIQPNFSFEVYKPIGSLSFY